MLLVHHPPFKTVVFSVCEEDAGKKVTFIKTYILPPQDTQSSTSSFYSHTIHADLFLKKKACLSKKDVVLWSCVMCSYVEDTNSPTLVKCYNSKPKLLPLLGSSQRPQVLG